MNWIELNLPLGKPYTDYDDDGKELDTFMSRQMFKPGVLLKLSTGEIRLIGHVNWNNGGCGCCSGFSSNDIVAAYCVVWELKESR